jgi:hypothetical protein
MTDKTNDLEARFQALADVNAQLMAALEARDQQGGGGITADQLEAIITRSTAAASKGSELIASKYKPEVVDPVPRGPFEHPDGGVAMPKPALKREMFFGGFRLRDGDISYVEAVALNTLSDSLGRSQRRLSRDGTWVAEVNDRNDRLTIRVPMKTIDDRAELPGMLQIAMELTSGDRALDQNDILAELALLKTEMAKLKATA